MTEVQAIPEGRSGLIPHLVVNDGDKAMEFYEKALGAKNLGAFRAPNGKVMHGEMQLGESIIYLVEFFDEMKDNKVSHPIDLGASSVTIHRYVEDVDATIAKAVSAGADQEMPTQDMFWGDRYGQIRDPFGHHWSFSTHIKDMTEEEMDAAGNEMFGGGDS